MGSRQCSKCDVMLEYYGTVGLSKNYSCRVHSYDCPNHTLTEKLINSTNEKKICVDCNNIGNCKHSFRYIICYGICC